MPLPPTRGRTSRVAELKTKPKAKSASKPKAKSASKSKAKMEVDIAALKVCISNLTDEIAEQETIIQRNMNLKTGMTKFRSAVCKMFAHRKIAVDYWKIITNLTFAELEVARQISEMMFEHDGEMMESHTPKAVIAELYSIIVDLEVFSTEELTKIFDPSNDGEMEKISVLNAANAVLNAAIAKFAEQELFSVEQFKSLTDQEIMTL